MILPKRSALIASALLFLTACSADARPVISFIGVATGTLVTDLGELQFNNLFDRDERNLVAVVGFEQVKEGTTVQATWFSPDDRNMPLGRTSITTQSGAKIARFSFASKDPWAAAPYLVQIAAFSPDAPEQSATGSVAFFIGMNDTEIAGYRKEFADWKHADDENRRLWEQEQERFQQLLGYVRRQLDFKYSSVLLRTDITGDRNEDYVVADMKEAPMPAESPGVLLSATVGRFAVVNNSGSVIFAVKDTGRARIAESKDVTLTNNLPHTDTMQLTVLASYGLSLYWPTDEQVCFAEFEPIAGGYKLSREGCRDN